MAVKEPINLKEWSLETPGLQRGQLFTCGRPGRAIYKNKRCRIDEGTIDLWVKGLPAAEVLHIISLLGEKKEDGYSEFTYYPFRSVKEPNTKPTLQAWLNQRYGQRFLVHEFQTVDCLPIPPADLEAVKRCAFELLYNGQTVVVVDSGGVSRTASVCKAMGYTKP